MVLPSLSASEFLEGVGCICLRSAEGLPANGDAFGLITLCSSAKLKSPSVQFSASAPTSVMSMLCTLFFDLLHFMMAAVQVQVADVSSKWEDHSLCVQASVCCHLQERRKKAVRAIGRGPSTMDQSSIRFVHNRDDLASNQSLQPQPF